ncbi:MAG: hypothetical protein QOJ29_2331, partial [Thermoleophilaceae bacterium]|nr:hypothetical protein [Thermoleophilaceae bacterium]
MRPDATPPAARRVLVTGGASGIGAEIARRFASDGARVAVLDRDPAALERFAGADTSCERTLAADVTDAASVDRAFETLEEPWGGIDVLFNNAGISRRESFLEMSLEAWEAVIAVNLTGCFLVAQRAARWMVRDGGGVIINIGSVSGIVGMPNYASYNSSKAGVIELTKTMAL